MLGILKSQEDLAGIWVFPEESAYVHDVTAHLRSIGQVFAYDNFH